MKRFSLLFSFIALMFVSSAFGQTEEIIYQTGFESSEGFTAATTYNLPETLAGPDGGQWGTFYGTPTTTDKITGNQSLQMRWYTNSVSSLGYTRTNFDLESATKVTFKAKSTNGLKLTVSHSIDNGVTYQSDQTFSLTTTANNYEYLINSGGTTAMLKFSITLPTNTPSSTSRLTIDDIIVYGLPEATPTISVNTNSLLGFIYSLGNGPSTSKSFALSGSSLDPATGDITITPPSNYEVSSNNTSFSSSAITIPYSDGVLSSTNIYVRLKDGLSVGDFNGSVTITGGGATQQTVSLTGSVINALAPVLIADNANNTV